MKIFRSLVYLFTIVLVINSSLSSAQEVNWKWCKSAVGVGTDKATAIATDGGGNIIVAGNFKSKTLNFGSVTLKDSITTTTEMFMAKYTSTGALIWAKSLGNLGDEEANDICTDATGNIYLAGFFQSDTLDFGNGIKIYNSSSFAEPFVAKFTSNGVIVWANSARGSEKDVALGVAVDASGNVFITGYFESDSLIFDTIPSAQIKREDNSDLYIAKYNSSGAFQWVKSAGGAGVDQALAITADNSGNAIITGYFDSPYITFGTFQLTNTSSFSDMFIVKYNTSGTALWAKIVTGEYSETGYGIESDGSGNIYVCGDFSSDNIVIGTFPLSNATPGLFYDDIFVAKYNSSGTVQWVKSAGGNMSDYANSIDVDDAGNCYVTGNFGSLSMTVGTYTLTNANTEGKGEIYVIKYNSTGDVVKALSAQSSGDDDSKSIAAYSNNAFIAGFHTANPNILFGASLSLKNTGKEDIVIASLGYGVSIKDEEFDNHFSVFPNPVHDQFSLSANGNASGKYNCKIYDITGKLLTDINIDFKLNNIHQFSVPSGYKGLMMVLLTSETGQMFTRTIVVN
jgi:hypothetical protein